MMARSFAFAWLILAAALPGTALAQPLSEAAAMLDGDWRSADFVLRVDSERAQASLNPAQPFAWQRFEVKEVTGNEVVFSVGPDIFQAVVDADVLVLTGTSFRGERVLFHDLVLRGTTTD